MEDKGRGWIIAIAVFRIVKAVVLIAASIGLLSLIDSDLPELGDRLIEWLDLDRDRAIVERFLEKLPGITPRMLVAAGVGGLAYATLFLVEAYGLLRRRSWGEWLTVVATSVFIPFEIYELVKGSTALKVTALVVNVLIVAYLLWRRLHERAQRQRFVLGAA